jgi:hypothetical protein
MVDSRPPASFSRCHMLQGKKKTPNFFRVLRLRLGKKLVPFEFGIHCGGLVFRHGHRRITLLPNIKLGEINAWHELVFHVAYRIIEGTHEFIEILLIEEDLVLFIRESIIILIVALLAFCDGQVIVI